MDNLIFPTIDGRPFYTPEQLNNPKQPLSKAASEETQPNPSSQQKQGSYVGLIIWLLVLVGFTLYLLYVQPIQLYGATRTSAGVEA